MTTQLPTDPATETPRPTDQHSVLLVEDHPITRAGLAALIRRDPRLQICGEAETAAAALEEIARLSPSVVVLDIALKGPTNGLSLTTRIAAEFPQVPVLILSMYDDSLYAERAVRAGARGYVVKSDASTKIVEAIHAILGGDIYLGEQVKRKLLGGVVNRRASTGATFPIDSMSARETEVYRLIGNGFTTREIAARLSLSTKTIDSYREHLKQKLDCEDSCQLVRGAIHWARLEEPIDDVKEPAEASK